MGSYFANHLHNFDFSLKYSEFVRKFNKMKKNRTESYDKSFNNFVTVLNTMEDIEEAIEYLTTLIDTFNLVLAPPTSNLINSVPFNLFSTNILSLERHVANIDSSMDSMDSEQPLERLIPFIMTTDDEVSDTDDIPSTSVGQTIHRHQSINGIFNQIAENLLPGVRDEGNFLRGLRSERSSNAIFVKSNLTANTNNPTGNFYTSRSKKRDATYYNCKSCRALSEKTLGKAVYAQIIVKESEAIVKSSIHHEACRHITLSNAIGYHLMKSALRDTRSPAPKPISNYHSNLKTFQTVAKMLEWDWDDVLKEYKKYEKGKNCFSTSSSRYKKKQVDD